MSTLKNKLGARFLALSLGAAALVAAAPAEARGGHGGGRGGGHHGGWHGGHGHGWGHGWGSRYSSFGYYAPAYYGDYCFYTRRGRLICQ